MPRIGQVPLAHLDDQSRAVIEGELAAGRMGHPQFAQTMAHSPRLFPGFINGVKAGPYGGAEKTFGRAFCELLRIRSAQIGGCGPCGESRYEKSLSEETLACAITDPSGLSRREQLALEMLRRMHTDYRSIDDAFFQDLAGEFSIVEIVELSAYISGMVGGHRLLHVLDLLGDQEPAFPYDPVERAANFAPAGAVRASR